MAADITTTMPLTQTATNRNLQQQQRYAYAEFLIQNFFLYLLVSVVESFHCAE